MSAATASVYDWDEILKVKDLAKKTPRRRGAPARPAPPRLTPADSAPAWLPEKYADRAYLTTTEIMRISGLSRKTVYRLIRQHPEATLKPTPRRFLVRVPYLEALLGDTL
ncbi:helix-turn-helix domain-containing protein [Nanchangia anserum]|uniref:Helix-turn-helix domain-containing protein n=1 Tax=Nanchangia anserum TaxID=2692125 RepID=A0A8I0G9X2_9ACTO|nr:helix-turn-helix domain-containing protein [Nanchangia anserum]MBD3689849.1 helix-turn-helix domain-containing protein [Nanchangia anserum]QOX82014.1 helix-turn-helix domain-containing protein [Nanchangia anserum]